MSTISSGLNDVYSLTAQINAAQEGKQATNLDPENFQVLIAQNFSKMLNDLISTSNDDDEEKSYDIFKSFYKNSSTNSLTNLKDQSTDSLAMQSYLLQNKLSSGII